MAQSTSSSRHQAASAPVPVRWITNTVGVRNLSPAAAGGRQPVRLSGALTYFDDAEEQAYVQDGDTGVFFVPGPTPAGMPTPKPGDRIELAGFTDPGEFTPIVNGGPGAAHASVRVLSHGALPVAAVPAVDELQEGRFDGRLVRVRGVVRRVSTPMVGKVQAPVMTLQWGTVQLEICWPQSADRQKLNGLIDSRVEVTAVCGGNSNNNRQLTDIRLYCAGLDSIRVIEAPLPTAQLPIRPLGSLLRFDAPRAGGHRVKVVGTVLGPGPSGSYFLWDGTNGVRIQPASALALNPGDRVECLAFPALGVFNPALQDAVVHVLGSAPLPAPELRESPMELGDSSESKRVMIYAVLQQQAVGPEGHTLTLRWGDALYFATLPALKLDPDLAAIPVGSEVSVVAVPSVFLDAQRHPSNFRLWLAQANDVQVLRSASWWTPGRVRAGAILMAVVLMVTLGFGFQLTRRTRALEAEVRERKRVEEELRKARKGLEDAVAQREFRLFSINEEREQIARELRQRESLVQEVIEALPDIVVVRDATGRIVLSNAAAGQFLGIKPSKKRNAQDLSGVPIASPELSPADRAVLKSGREIASPPEQWQGRDGSVRWFEVTRRRITRPDGTRFLLGVATEVTARKLAEEEQRRARESADAANRAKGDFLARMSHEIRTPMNGVIGMVNLMLGTPLASEQRDFAETALRSAEGLLAIINDILDFSKIEAGKLTMESVEFDLRIMLEESLDLVAERAQSKGLELMLSMPQNIPTWVVGDPGRLRQVLLNLVGNAVKFTERGIVVVTVFREPAAEGDPVFHIGVEDTGKGIPPQLQQRLFKPFEQGEESGTRKSGTGLGLVISKHLIELMGGEISVQSEVGLGTRFAIKVPMRVPKVDHVSGLPDPRLGGIRVAVVAAGSRLRTILGELVRTVGAVDAGSFSDGISALNGLRELATQGEAVSVLLVDQSTGSVGPLELIRLVRSDPALTQTRIIQLLPLAHSAMASTIQPRGGDGFLFKPVKAALLGDRIATVLSAPVHGATVDAPEIKPPTSATLPAEPTEPEGTPEGLTKLPISLRLLIAEDNPTNQKLAVYVLKKLGCESVVVGNGAEALAALEASPFDLILMDCQMPELDGFEATRRIRRSTAEWSTIPIVAVTAAAMIGDRDRCLASGMNDYLTKPLRPLDLRAALMRNLPERLRNKLDSAPAEDRLDRSAREELIADDAEGGQELYRELVQIFLTSVPKLMRDLQLGSENRNLETIRAAAHTLKGSCSAMGARRLGSLTRLLEVAAHHGEIDQALRLVQEVTREFEEVAQLLRPEAGEPSGTGTPPRPVGGAELELGLKVEPRKPGA